MSELLENCYTCVNAGELRRLSGDGSYIALLRDVFGCVVVASKDSRVRVAVLRGDVDVHSCSSID